MGRFCVNHCDWRHATRMAAVLSATSSYGALEVGERLVHSGAPGARNAAIVANFLSNHPKVACVHYPPLLPADHPMQKLMERQSSSAGSTFSFDVKGDQADAFASSI